jgi:hypothetical protein
VDGGRGGAVVGAGVGILILMPNLYKNYYQLIQAAEDCIDKRMTLPALILIYTGIDTVSWIAGNNSNEGVKTRFENWVNVWMLSKGKLNCTAEELYAARCGVLHTLTPSSDLSEKKGVRKIAYAWGKATRDTLEESVSVLSMNNKVASVHLEDLFWCFREGFADYLDHVYSHTEEQEKFSMKSSQHFVNLTIEQMDDLLNLHKARQKLSGFSPQRS